MTKSLDWTEQEVVDPHIGGATAMGLVGVTDGLTFHVFDIPDREWKSMSIRVYAYIGDKCVADLRARLPLDCSIEDATEIAEEFDVLKFLLDNIEYHRGRLDRYVDKLEAEHAEANMYLDALAKHLRGNQLS